MALRGIPSYFAVSGSCANVMPPSTLIARSPSVPSVAVPERITPTARSFWSAASDTRKLSTDLKGCGPDGRSSTASLPRLIERLALGGMT